MGWQDGKPVAGATAKGGWQSGRVVKPNLAADVLKSAATGVGQAVTGLVGLRGDLQDLQGNLVEKGFQAVGRKLNLFTPEQIAAQDRSPGWSTEYSRTNGAVTSPQVNKLVGLTYEPQTAPGKYARTAGNFAGNALLPGGLVRKAASVVVPAVASEGAGQAVEAAGGGAGAQAAARFVGVMAGSAIPHIGVSPAGLAPAAEAAAMAEATSALEGAGVNVRSLSSTTMDQIRMQVRQGRDAREAAMGVVANTELPVPLPMTRGQRTGQPGQQMTENLMLRGARGSAASRQMRGLVDEQQQALRDNVEAIGAQVAGGPLPPRGESIARASERLNTMYDQAGAGVDNAYDAARAATGDAVLPSQERMTAGSRIREALTSHDELRVPSVFREIDRLGQAPKLGPKELFDARSRLVTLQGSADGVERNAAGTAKRALDDYIGEALDRDLFSGNTEAVGLWRNAIGARRQFGRTFEGDDLVNKLTQRVDRGGQSSVNLVAPEDAANYILGRADMGFVGKQNLGRDLVRLRDTLGAESPEWNGVRGEIFQRIASQGEGGVEFGRRQFSGVKFQKAWQDFQRKDPTLAASLFTPAERDQIDRFAVLSARVTSPVRGGDNPSNTAVTAVRLLGNLRFLRGLPVLKEMTNELEVQINLGAARKATSPTPGPAARPPVRLNAFAQPQAITSAVSALNGRTSQEPQ